MSSRGMSRVTERWRPRIGRGVEMEVAVRTSAACWTVQASMRSSMGAMGGRGFAWGFAVVGGRVVASMVVAAMRGAVGWVGGGVDGV